MPRPLCSCCAPPATLPRRDQGDPVPQAAHCLPAGPPAHLLGSNGLVVGAVLHHLPVGQLRVPLLLQRPREPHPQLREEPRAFRLGETLSPRPSVAWPPCLTCGLMLCGMPASTRERSFSERGREAAILSQVRSPTSWLWVNSRWACHRSRWGGSSIRDPAGSLLELGSAPSARKHPGQGSEAGGRKMSPGFQSGAQIHHGHSEPQFPWPKEHLDQQIRALHSPPNPPFRDLPGPHTPLYSQDARV